jgi:hypothetical protein
MVMKRQTDGNIKVLRQGKKRWNEEGTEEDKVSEV